MSDADAVPAYSLADAVPSTSVADSLAQRLHMLYKESEQKDNDAERAADVAFRAKVVGIPA